MNCTICNDTGKRILSNGQHSDYVDCSCQAATERAELDVAVTVFVQSYEGDLQNAPADTRWFVHQRATQLAEKKAAARIAELERENARLDAALDGEISCRDHYHEWADKLAAEISRYFGVDIGEHSNANNPWEQAYEAVPAAPAVEQQPVAYIAQLTKTSHKALTWSNHGGFVGTEYIPLYTAPPAANTDKVREALKMAVIRSTCNQIMSGEEMRQCEAALSSMAAQAPVREVPEVTSDMMNAGADAMREGIAMLNSGRSYQSICKKVFDAMLAAAPLPAAPVQQEGE